MRQSTRLIVNTGATYARMLITFVVSVLLTRWLLRALGELDFGLMAALGAAPLLLATLKDSLTDSGQRHLAFETGRDNGQAVAEVFNTLLWIYVCLAMVVLLIGLSLTPLIIGLLTIPESRILAAKIAFVLSIVTMAFTVLMTPFDAMLRANQELVWTAVLDLSGRILALVVVGLLYVSPSDRLVTYLALSLVATVVVSTLQAVICMRILPASKPHPRLFQRQRLREIIGYTAWSLLGIFTLRLNDQGGVLILNIAFGPIVNAAYAIGQRCVATLWQLASGVLGAIHPAMTRYEGAGNQQAVRRLVLLSTAIAAFMTLLIFCPVLIETPILLRLWLGDVPAHSVALTRILMIAALIGLLGTGHTNAMRARGEIGRLTWIGAIVQLVGLAFSIVLVMVFHTSLYTVPILWLMIQIVAATFWPWYVGRIIDLPMRTWARRVVLPVFVTGAVALVAGLAIRTAFHESLLRLSLVLTATTATILPMGWFLGLTIEDRHYFIRFGGQVIDWYQRS